MIPLTPKTDVQDHRDSPVCHISDKNVKTYDTDGSGSAAIRLSFNHGTSYTEEKVFSHRPKSL